MAVETLGRSDQLHSVLNRFGIEAIPESLRVRMGDHEDQIEFRVASVGQDKDPYCRALLRRRSIIEVEKLSIVVACLPFHNSDASEEDGLQCSDDSVQKLDDNLDVALSHVINQLLNHLACERGIVFGRSSKELCVRDILIPSIASDVNAGLEMLHASSNANSCHCSQLFVEAILLNLGESTVQELASEEQPLVLEGVRMLLKNCFEKSQRRQRRQQIVDPNE